MYQQTQIKKMKQTMRTNLSHFVLEALQVSAALHACFRSSSISEISKIEQHRAESVLTIPSGQEPRRKAAEMQNANLQPVSSGDLQSISAIL